MDSAVVEHRSATPSRTEPGARRRPRRAEAEAAVRTLIEWAGDDPDREGLKGTPERVVRAYEEFFAGYAEDPVALLASDFETTAAYDQMIVLRDIRLESHCEHHIVPILGKAHVGYLPAERVVGISKLVRLVEVSRSSSITLTDSLYLRLNRRTDTASTIEADSSPFGLPMLRNAARLTPSRTRDL